MKRLFLFFCFFGMVSLAIAQSNSKTESFKVYGNCGTCKSNIEGSLKKKDGVIKKDWDKETEILTVTYDPAKINLLQIKQKVADAGYDSEEVRAKDEAYFKLHKCCQYDRPKKD
jgi:periplasmic mercuric ion binding protein